jgi:hypothetical protein
VALTLEADTATPTPFPGSVPAAKPIDEVEAIDPAELIDAPVDHRRGLDVLSQHFPDAQLFEEDDET